MNRFRILMTAATFAVLAAVSLAIDPVGKWTGKINIDMSSIPMPKNMTPQQKQQMQMGMDMVKKMRVALTLNANHTYSAMASGGPTPTKENEGGTWSLAGNKLTLKPGAKSKNKQPQTLTLAANGKSMSMAIPGGKAKGSIVFTR